MSAIFGLIHLNDRLADKSELERMNAALANHGAAGDIWWQGFAGLGQRPLCFTPEDRGERQPLIFRNGQAVLVSDGRIDNREEVLHLIGGEETRLAGGAEYDLRQNPGPARAVSNGELIVRAYEKWGEDCVHHLVGVFAFALWDAGKQQMMIVRSPIVAPALFYFTTPREFAFATMPSGLHALPFVPKAINEEKLADKLVQSFASPSATLFRDIWRLPTGHALRVSRDGIKERCFWRPDLRRELRLPRDEDYVAAFDELFERVMRDHLRSVTPVGVMMSGGLDSPSVAVTAARLLRQRGERLAAFTEVPRAGFEGPVPPGRYADETPFVQAIAAMHDNIDLNLVRTGARTFLDDLDRSFFHLEGPVRNTSNRIWIEAIMQTARQRGIQVVLDGSQGNLTVSWHGGGLLPGLLRRGKLIQAWREARAVARQDSGKSVCRALAVGAWPLLPAPVSLAFDRLRGRVTAPPWRAWSPIHRDFAAQYMVAERARERGIDLSFRETGDSRDFRYDALRWQDIGEYCSSNLSLFGVDSRSPLADVRLAEFCLALPERQHLHHGRPRALVRRAMADRLPAQVLANRRRGLQAADWFERSTQVRGRIAAELERLEDCDLARRALDLKRMRGLVERWPEDGWGRLDVLRKYGLLLERGLTVGLFLCWIDGTTGAEAGVGAEMAV